MSLELTSAQRRSLRARAHAAHATIMIGEAGLTPAVISEINKGLAGRDLLKIRVLQVDRSLRARWLDEICAELGAAPVQHIGKMLVIYRPLPPAAERQTGQPQARPPRRKPPRRTKRSFQNK